MPKHSPVTAIVCIYICISNASPFIHSFVGDIGGKDNLQMTFGRCLACTLHINVERDLFLSNFYGNHGNWSL